MCVCVHTYIHLIMYFHHSLCAYLIEVFVIIFKNTYLNFIGVSKMDFNLVSKIIVTF